MRELKAGDTVDNGVGWKHVIVFASKERNIVIYDYVDVNGDFTHCEGRYRDYEQTFNDAQWRVKTSPPPPPSPRCDYPDAGDFLRCDQFPGHFGQHRAEYLADGLGSVTGHVYWSTRAVEGEGRR